MDWKEQMNAVFVKISVRVRVRVGVIGLGLGLGGGAGAYSHTHMRARQGCNACGLMGHDSSILHTRKAGLSRMRANEGGRDLGT